MISNKNTQVILTFTLLLVLVGHVEAVEMTLTQEEVTNDFQCTYKAENKQYGISGLNIDLYIRTTECLPSMVLFFDKEQSTNQILSFDGKECRYEVQHNKQGVTDLELTMLFDDKEVYQCPPIMRLLLTGGKNKEAATSVSSGGLPPPEQGEQIMVEKPIIPQPVSLPVDVVSSEKQDPESSRAYAWIWTGVFMFFGLIFLVFILIKKEIIPKIRLTMGGQNEKQKIS